MQAKSRSYRGSHPIWLAAAGAVLVGLFMLAGMPDAKANGALGAASAGLEAQTAEAGQGLRHRVWFHHRKKPQALYCVDNNYWWYYRPYNTKGGQPVSEAYARCMPYFHYTEEAYGGAPQGPVK